MLLAKWKLLLLFFCFVMRANEPDQSRLPKGSLGFCDEKQVRAGGHLTSSMHQEFVLVVLETVSHPRIKV